MSVKVLHHGNITYVPLKMEIELSTEFPEEIYEPVLFLSPLDFGSKHTPFSHFHRQDNYTRSSS
jgi:hypothetical protein